MKEIPTDPMPPNPWKHSGSEAAPMAQLARIARSLRSCDEEATNSCIAHGLLPSDVVNFLCMARFLSVVVPPAQRAQRIYGVPASLLIANTILDHSWDLGRMTASYWTRLFNSTAKKLAADPMCEVLLSMTEPQTFLRTLADCQAFDELRRKDLVGYITQYGLQQLDAPGTTAPNVNWRWSVARSNHEGASDARR
jgi:hypothetical protein